MEKNDWIAEQFEANRPHLRAVAYRMLASASEADDAVQEAWLRLSRCDASSVANLSAWLTTVVARIALDILRSRKARREEPMGAHLPELELTASRARENDPEHEAILADSVGIALLVVLDRLSPAERLAFVLHDMFALPFSEIAAIADCSPAAARQLASRARRRVQGRVPGSAPGAAEASGADFVRRREVAGAFFAASREGDFNALLAVLDPDVVLRADSAAVPPGGREVRGAATVAAQAVAGRAANSAARGQFSQLALVDGSVGILVAPGGRLRMVIALTIESEKITQIEVIADAARLRQLDLAILGD